MYRERQDHRADHFPVQAPTKPVPHLTAALSPPLEDEPLSVPLLSTGRSCMERLERLRKHFNNEGRHIEAATISQAMKMVAGTLVQ